MQPNSDHSRSCVDPGRLIEAADAIVQAESRSTRTGAPVKRTDASLDSGEGFTSVELVEAYRFLCRLGVLESNDHKRS
jgi:hypothetical protein